MTELTRAEYAGLLDKLPPEAVAAAFNQRSQQIAGLPTSLAKWMKERRRIEEEYATSLRNLSNRHVASEKDEWGTFTEAWKMICTSTTRVADAHDSLARGLEADVISGLAKFDINSQVPSRLTSFEEGLNSMQKMRQNITRMALDLEHSQKRGGRRSERDERELEQALLAWESETPLLFDHLRDLDNARWEAVKSSLVLLQTLDTDAADLRQKCASENMETLLQTSIEDELRLWGIRQIENPPSLSESRQMSGNESSVSLQTALRPSASRNGSHGPFSNDGDPERLDVGSSSKPQPNSTKSSSSRFNPLRRLGTVLGRKKTQPQSASPTRGGGTNNHRFSMSPFSKLGGSSKEAGNIPEVPSADTMESLPESRAADGDSPAKRLSREERPFTAPGTHGGGSGNSLAGLEPLAEDEPPMPTGPAKFDLRIRDEPIQEEEDGEREESGNLSARSMSSQDARKSLFFAMGSPKSASSSLRGRRAFQSMLVSPPPDVLAKTADGITAPVLPEVLSIKARPEQASELELANAPEPADAADIEAEASKPKTARAVEMKEDVQKAPPVTTDYTLSTPHRVLDVPANTPMTPKAVPPPPPPPRVHSSSNSEHMIMPRMSSGPLPSVPVQGSSAAAAAAATAHSVVPESVSDTHSIRSGISQTSVGSNAVPAIEMGESSGGVRASIVEKREYHAKALNDMASLDRAEMSIYGEVKMARSEEEVSSKTVLLDGFSPNTIKVASNPKLARVVDGCRSGEMFKVDIGRVVVPTTIFKYNSAPVERDLPLKMQIQTKKEIAEGVWAVMMAITVTAAPSFAQEAEGVESIGVRIQFDPASGAIGDCRLKPYTGRFMRNSGLVYWVIPSGSVGQDRASVLMVRVTGVAGGAAPRPSRAEVAWKTKGEMGGGQEGERVGLSFLEAAEADPFADGSDEEREWQVVRAARVVSSRVEVTFEGGVEGPVGAAEGVEDVEGVEKQAKKEEVGEGPTYASVSVGADASTAMTADGVPATKEGLAGVLTDVPSNQPAAVPVPGPEKEETETVTLGEVGRAGV